MLLTKEQYDGLSDDLKAGCTEVPSANDGAGGWEFDPSTPAGEPTEPTDSVDTGPLKRALDREKQLKADAAQRADEAEKRLSELEAKIEDSQHNDLRKSGDIEALERSWNEKYALLRTEAEKQVSDLKAEYEGQLTSYRGTIEKQLVDNVAQSMAMELAADPKHAPALEPHLKSRLSVDWDAEQPTTRILSRDFQPSVLTNEDLFKEIRATEHLAPLILGTRAKGSIDGEKKVRKFEPGEKHDITKMSKEDAKEYVESKMGIE